MGDLKIPVTALDLFDIPSEVVKRNSQFKAICNFTPEFVSGNELNADAPSLADFLLQRATTAMNF
jgi:hypothetical protein